MGIIEDTYKTCIQQMQERLERSQQALKTYRIALDNISERAMLIAIETDETRAIRDEADHALEQVKLMNVKEAE